METRNYEYVVYPQARVEGEGIKVVPSSLGSNVGLNRAKSIAKTQYGSGAAIYSVSKGRFVGWITPTGRYSPFGRGRENPTGLSGTEIALIAGGVLAVGVVGYLIYSASQPAAAATIAPSILPSTVSPSATLTCGPTPDQQTPCTPQQAAINPMVDWTPGAQAGS
jgi:hypothetical protein